MIAATSPEWPAEKRWLEAQIAKAHAALETPGMVEADTNMLRGEIRAYRNRIVAAGEAEQPLEQQPGGNTPYV